MNQINPSYFRIHPVATIIFIFCILPICAFGQNENLKVFKINGKINVDTGTVQLTYSESNKGLYPKKFSTTSSKIKNGKFTFLGKVSSPIWVSFTLGNTFRSEPTAIVAGNQNISIDTARNSQKLDNNNDVMKDVEKYERAFVPYERKILKYRLEYDSLFNIYGTKFPDDLMLKSMKDLKLSYSTYDSLLRGFVKDNPNSYYALFKLYHLISFGYTKNLAEAYQNLSVTLKKSPQGKETLKIILASKSIAVGAKIPNFNVKNLNGDQLKADYFKTNKFTLIDLWYSHCMPCIAMFEDYKLIRNANHNKGFEIIAISTDKAKFVNDWKEVIAKYELPWPQYLDLDGVEAHKYYIHKFPTSFLVNQTGEIVASDLSIVELKDFLNRNL